MSDTTQTPGCRTGRSEHGCHVTVRTNRDRPGRSGQWIVRRITRHQDDVPLVYSSAVLLIAFPVNV